MSLPSITAKELYTLMPEVLLIDVREPTEYFIEGYIQHAHLLPTSSTTIADYLSYISQCDETTKIIFYCRKGHRSANICVQLLPYRIAYNLTEGTEGWLEAGFSLSKFDSGNVKFSLLTEHPRHISRLAKYWYEELKTFVPSITLPELQARLEEGLSSQTLPFTYIAIHETAPGIKSDNTRKAAIPDTTPDNNYVATNSSTITKLEAWAGQASASNEVEEQESAIEFKTDGHPSSYVNGYGGQVIGMCSCTLHPHEDLRPDLSPWLVGLVVDTNFRNQKLGERLIAEVKKRTRALHYAKLYLITGDNLPVWYEKLGWNRVEKLVTKHMNLATIMSTDL